MANIFFILTGGIIGSFLNAFIYRYETGQSLGGRSFCPICKEQVNWYDNIPLLSWFILGGKCRSCKKNISVQYPLVELVAGIITLLIAQKIGFTAMLNDYLFNFKSFEPFVLFLFFILNFLFLILLTISVYDIKTKEIPNGFNLIFISLAAFYLVLKYNEYGIQNTTYFVVTAIIAFLLFWSLVCLSKETWMGGGDAKLVFGIGLLLGPWLTFLAIFLASVLGSVYGICLLVFEKFIRNSKSETQNSHEIPFGPFLALGCFISFMFGSQIVDLYVKMFLGL